MNKQNKQRLIDLQMSEAMLNYPMIPGRLLSVPKLNDNNANGLTKCIVTFLNLSGHQAERINTTGSYRPGKQAKDCRGTMIVVEKGKFIPTTGTKGSADISATIKGLSVKIEIKYGKDRMSDNQRSYQQSIERAGGVYIVSHTFDDFLVWYDSFIKAIAL